LHCDGKLPLYRKITSGQFCSATHRRAYWKEQERLAVERLSQTHDSLRAYRPPGADAILGLPAGLPVENPSSPVSHPAAPASNPFYLDGQPYQDDAVLEFARTASNRDKVDLAGFVRNVLPLACDWISSAALSAPGPVSFGACAPEILGASGATPVFLFGFSDDKPVAETIELASSIVPAAVKWNRRAVQPLKPAAASVSREIELGMEPEKPASLRTPPVEIRAEPLVAEKPAVVEKPVVAEEPVVAAELAVAAEPVIVELTEPVLAELAEPVIAELVEPVIAEPAFMAGLAALAKPATWEDPGPVARPLPVQNSDAVISPSVVLKPALVAQEAPAPLMAGTVPFPLLAGLTLGGKPGAGTFEFSLSRVETAPLENPIAAPVLMPLAKDTVSRTLGSAKMLALVAPRTSASASAPAGSSVQAVDVSVASSALKDSSAPKNLPPSGLEVPPVAAQMPLANAVRYPLRSGGSAPPRHQIAPEEAAVRAVDVPELPLRCVSSIQEPGSAWLAKLPVNLTPVALEPARAFAASLGPVFPNGAEPNPPRTGLEPVDGAAVPPPPRSFLAFANWTPGDPSERRNAWEHVSDFWAHAPRDLKLLLFAIPVLLSLALHPHLPKVHVTAPSGSASAGLGKNFQQVFAQQVNTFQQNVASRAGVALAEDFRSGLDDWQTHGDLSTAWSFDANGFVRPGSLALYRPSMRLSDYDLQFLGLIDKKALSFVARAEDFANYYVIKLVVLKPGPLPTIGVTRYAVIHGKAQNRVDSIAPITAMPDMLYHVDLNVHDDTFLLSLQGKIVDNWSEPRLARGGVGFFAPRGEESRVRWVQLTHQYDMLGRLCAYLAPYNISTTNGSF
jgi:hypothetical protein